MSDSSGLAEQAIGVLKRNDRGLFTVPNGELYPHQWLWDSCFIGIGLRHVDVERAKLEVLSLLRGQWSNGMVPNMIFTPGPNYRQRHDIWRSWLSPFAPEGVLTSGITQPPLLAEVIVRIGEKLELPERRSWYRQVFPALLSYHQWLYRERDPHGEGLALLIHPWETGMDNSPPWMAYMQEHLLPWWIRVLQTTRLDWLVSITRRDTRRVPLRQRDSTIEALALFDAQRRLRRKSYDIDRILDHSLFAIEDLMFNSVLIRNNTLLRDIAKSLRTELPTELLESMQKAEKTLEELWDPYTSSYYSRDFVTHKFLKEPSIATLMPLYAGTISAERAAALVKDLENEHMFGPAYPVPSTPLNSTWFNAERYWQGPVWFSTNWLVADGLKRYGYRDHAAALIEGSLELAKEHGFYEYFNPLTGAPLGASDFSWTAAIALDWVKTSKIRA